MLPKYGYYLIAGILLLALLAKFQQFAIAQNIPSAEEEAGIVERVSNVLNETSQEAEIDSTEPQEEFRIDDANPDPFENEVETTLFDIYLGDKFKGSVLANYTEHWLEVSDPAEVLDQLKDLKRVEELLPLVKGKINKDREIKDLGRIHFNLNNFSLIIDINPKFLEMVKRETKQNIRRPILYENNTLFYEPLG